MLLAPHGAGSAIEAIFAGSVPAIIDGVVVAGIANRASPISERNHLHTRFGSPSRNCTGRRIVKAAGKGGVANGESTINSTGAFY
jgi:hypothetical protein